MTASAWVAYDAARTETDAALARILGGERPNPRPRPNTGVAA